MWQDILQIIHEHDAFVITTHVNPDGDGIGSGCALSELLIQMGKQVRFVCDSPFPGKYRFLNYREFFEEYDDTTCLEGTEVLIVLDTHNKNRIGRLAQLAEDPKVKTICIDHHERVNPLTLNGMIDPKACSVGAMIYQLYEESEYSLNYNAAAGVYVSIITDTGRFSYSSTDSQAHKIADSCITLGVNPDLMHSRLYQHVPLSQIRLFAKALDRMETHHDDRVVIEEIRQEDYESLEDLGDIGQFDLDCMHDFNKSMENVECVILLRELPNNEVRISARSKSDFDVGALMRQVGGGGHSQAAGVNWHLSLAEAKQKILELLEEYFAAESASSKGNGL